MYLLSFMQTIKQLICCTKNRSKLHSSVISVCMFLRFNPAEIAFLVFFRERQMCRWGGLYPPSHYSRPSSRTFTPPTSTVGHWWMLIFGAHVVPPDSLFESLMLYLSQCERDLITAALDAGLSGSESCSITNQPKSSPPSSSTQTNNTAA